MVVATLVMAIAVVGLLAGISGATRNAARLRDYDRVAQLARLRMNELLVDPNLRRNVPLAGIFDPALTGGLDAGWTAQMSVAEMPPQPAPGLLCLELIRLQVWWMAGGRKRTLDFEAQRHKTLLPQDLEGL